MNMVGRKQVHKRTQIIRPAKPDADGRSDQHEAQAPDRQCGPQVRLGIDAANVALANLIALRRNLRNSSSLSAGSTFSGGFGQLRMLEVLRSCAISATTTSRRVHNWGQVKSLGRLGYSALSKSLAAHIVVRWR